MKNKIVSRFVVAVLAALLLVPSASAQVFDRIERARMKEMLNNIKNSVKTTPRIMGSTLTPALRKRRKGWMW